MFVREDRRVCHSLNPDHWARRLVWLASSDILTALTRLAPFIFLDYLRKIFYTRGNLFGFLRLQRKPHPTSVMSAEMWVTFSTYSSDWASVFCSCSTEGLWFRSRLWKQPIPVRMVCLQVVVVNNEDTLYVWSVVVVTWSHPYHR